MASYKSLNKTTTSFRLLMLVGLAISMSSSGFSQTLDENARAAIMDLAEKEISLGNWRAASDQLETIFVHNPEEYYPIEDLVLCYVMQGRTPAAIAALESAMNTPADWLPAPAQFQGLLDNLSGRRFIGASEKLWEGYSNVLEIGISYETAGEAAALLSGNVLEAGDANGVLYTSMMRFGMRYRSTRVFEWLVARRPNQPFCLLQLGRDWEKRFTLEQRIGFLERANHNATELLRPQIQKTLEITRQKLHDGGNM